ncbi:MAG: nucleotidyltransferase family protein [Devosia sp.]
MSRESAQLDIILLAAGLSTRMGAENKMLLPFRGRPLVRRVAIRLLEADIGRIRVVTGFEANRVSAALAGLDLDIHFNPDFESGQMSSVRAGFRTLPEPTAGVMIALGDMPHLAAPDYRQVARAFLDDGGRQIAVPFFGEERGNPIVIPPRFVADVADGAINAGCRKLVRSRPDDILRVEVSRPAFIADIDTPDDFERATAGTPADREGQSLKGLEFGTQG